MNHYVLKLNFSITKKIKTIRNIQFSRNLRKLKINLKFFEYYRFFVDYYVKITKLLIKLKTRNFFNVSLKERRRKNYSQKTCLKQ